MLQNFIKLLFTRVLVATTSTVEVLTQNMDKQLLTHFGHNQYCSRHQHFSLKL